MKTKISRSRDHIVITFVGIPAILFLISLFILSYMLMNAMEPVDAEHRVRMILIREISQQHMDELSQTGTRIPDEQMAIRWLEEINKTKNLTIISLLLKNPILDIFTPDSPTFIVRAVIRDNQNEERVRYFWLSWADIDREISSLAWYFSI